MDQKSLSRFPEPPLSDDAPAAPAPARTNLRDDMLQVFNNLGGVEDMTAWVKESTANKRIFYSQILPRMIPRETKVTGGDGGPMRMVVEWAGGPMTIPTPAAIDAEVLDA